MIQTWLDSKDAVFFVGFVLGALCLALLTSLFRGLKQEGERALGMSRAFSALYQWHQQFGVPFYFQPFVPPTSRRELRVKLINEEAKEFSDASDAGDVVEAADALADLLYVTYGSAVEWGIPIDHVFEEVHRSNMTKVWPDGTVHYREDGKVLKPPSYSPANVRGVIQSANAGKPLGPMDSRVERHREERQTPK